MSDQRPPPRAQIPGTDTPFPEASFKFRAANFLIEKWGYKFILKILHMIQPFVTIAVGHLANTPESEQLIGAAIGAVVLGTLDLIISKLTNGKAQKLQRIYEDGAERERLAIEATLPVNSIVQKIIAEGKDKGEHDTQGEVVPPRTWVVEAELLDSPITYRPRKYASSMSDAMQKGEELRRMHANIHAINIYEPGDTLPL